MRFRIYTLSLEKVSDAAPPVGSCGLPGAGRSVGQPVDVEDQIHGVEPKPVELGRKSSAAIDHVRYDAVHLLPVVERIEAYVVRLGELPRRALGVASGYIGAGGNAGSTICMALFFTSASIATYDGIMYMGFTIIGVTLLVVPIHFPMWGSMFFPGDPNVSEEDYYIAREFSEEEIKEGLALSVQKFCQNSYQERAPSMRPVESSEAKV